MNLTSASIQNYFSKLQSEIPGASLNNLPEEAGEGRKQHLAYHLRLIRQSKRMSQIIAKSWMNDDCGKCIRQIFLDFHNDNHEDDVYVNMVGLLTGKKIKYSTIDVTQLTSGSDEGASGSKSKNETILCIPIYYYEPNSNYKHKVIKRIECIIVITESNEIPPREFLQNLKNFWQKLDITKEQFQESWEDLKTSWEGLKTSWEDLDQSWEGLDPSWEDFDKFRTSFKKSLNIEETLSTENTYDNNNVFDEDEVDDYIIEIDWGSFEGRMVDHYQPGTKQQPPYYVMILPYPPRTSDVNMEDPNLQKWLNDKVDVDNMKEKVKEMFPPVPYLPQTST